MNFDQPGWLALLLLIPLVVTGAALMARTRSKQWSAFVAPRLRQRLLKRSSPIPRWIAFACLMLASALLIIALARPQSVEGTRKEAILGRNILFALDLSRSMKTNDVLPDRLTQAKAACFELLDALPNDRIGLVGFAGTPYLFAPLTVDHSAIRETLTEIDIDWIPTGGSNIADGLELGIETLKATGTRQNALILMSDGEEHIGRITEVAESARAAGIEVITIGFGTTEGDFIPDPSFADGRFRDRNGREVISRLEPAALDRVATVTGGRFAIATSGADIPAMVEAAVADLDRVQLMGRETTVVVEYYQWFLLPAILLILASIVCATRWRGVSPPVPGPTATTLAMLAILLMGFPSEARASILDDARQAMSDARYNDAVSAYGLLAEKYQDTEEGFRFSLAQASAAYENGQWPEARRAFSEALRSEDSSVRSAAHHGLGNTLFQIGWQRLTDGPAYPEFPEPEDDEPDQEPEAIDRLSDALLEMPDPEDGADDDDTMAAFELLVKERLAEWMAEETEEGEKTRGGERFNNLLTDWADSIKHHRAATGVEAAKHNSDLTFTYLDKIREILDQTNDNAQQIQAVPQEGEGEPQPGEGEQEGEPQDNGEGEEEGDEGPDGDQSEEGGDGGDQRESGEEPRDGEPQESEDEAEDKGPRPGETPEEAARRILNENADLQKGALSPGRIRFRRPDKDW
ncbi:vWA domain-containing protein [Haloferula rosea]|uniref:VWA domain-containing protein n=1 Tax=Haloferula rosea TaxID=490093 RepID=A0A934R686_9BACT|nr:VWA domain-containing protein [Haloferula rosea]MBK1826064.1 VWA domain-containing protein [Haloferula rosea]